MDKTFETKIDLILEIVTNLNERVTVLDDRMSNLETRMTVLDNRLSRLETRMSVLENRISKLEDRMYQIESEVAHLKTQVSSHEKGESVMSVEISKIWTVVSKYDEKLDYLMNRESDNTQKFEIHQTYLDNHDKRILRLEVRDEKRKT